jgi:hypothetical protein
VKDVNPFSPRAPDAAVKIGSDPDIALLTIETDAVTADLANDAGRVVLRRAIVNHLNLHRRRVWSLGQHTAKGRSQVIGAVVRWDHY